MRVRLYVPEILLGLFLTVAVYAIGHVVGSSGNPQTNQQINAQTSEVKKPNPFSFEWFTLDAPGFFAGLAFLVAVLQAGLVIWQLVLIRRSLKPAERAAQAAAAAADHIPRIERAYVFIEPKFSSPGASRINIEYAFYNHGKTPAVVKSLDVRAGVLEAGPDNTTHVPNQTIRDDRVLPASNEWGPMYASCTYTDAERAALMARETHVWFYGSLVYEDIFGVTRVTRFRWKLKDWVKGRFHADGLNPYNERT